MKANIIYIGKSVYKDKKGGEHIRRTHAKDIPTFRKNGHKKIELPSGAEQLKGFYHEDASFLVNTYRNEFKPIVAKAAVRAKKSPK